MVVVEELSFPSFWAQNKLLTESDLHQHKSSKANKTYINHVCTQYGAKHRAPTGHHTDCKMTGNERIAKG